MNKKRGLLLVVFLLGLAMVVSVEAGEVTCGNAQSGKSCDGNVISWTFVLQGNCKSYCENQEGPVSCCHKGETFTYEGQLVKACTAYDGGIIDGEADDTAYDCESTDSNGDDNGDDEYETYEYSCCLDEWESNKALSALWGLTLLGEDLTQDDCKEICGYEGYYYCEWREIGRCLGGFAPRDTALSTTYLTNPHSTVHNIKF